MTSSTVRLLRWSPRVLGILLALFLGMFALDSFGKGIVAFAIHLAPAFLMLLVVALSWRHEWLGATCCFALALLYAAFAWRHPDWIVAISGPLATVGVLYLWSWRHPDEPPQIETDRHGAVGGVRNN